LGRQREKGTAAKKKEAMLVGFGFAGKRVKEKRDLGGEGETGVFSRGGNWKRERANLGRWKP